MITATNLQMKNTPALNFELAPGFTHGLVGANGVGKTTLLRMMAGQFPRRACASLVRIPSTTNASWTGRSSWALTTHFSMDGT